MPIPAGLPENECERLLALRSLDVLDTESEAGFDHITELAADIFAAPIALVSLVDENRQWFKSKQGLDAPETSRDLAFCAHAILQENVFYVPDATKDPRFSDSPLVVGPPHIRTYLGAPLVTEGGFALGTLCVIWDKVTAVPLKHFTRLSKLSKLVVDELQLRQLVATESEAKAALERASQMKSQFLATVSHEIRTPLGGIMGMLDLLKGEDIPDQQSEIVDGAHASAKCLLHVVNDILDFSKLEAEGCDLESIPFNLVDVLTDVIDTYHCLATKKGLTLRYESNVSDISAFQGDPHRIRQILNNFVGNAIKFTPSGQIVISCSSIGGDAESTTLRFQVRDTGIGIPEGRREAIFEDFSQADATVSRKYGGTGLGLAIARRLVELMGGEIGVKSHVGEGSEFWFTLSLKRHRDPKQEKAPAPVVYNETSLQKLRILVAEDNLINQKVITAYLAMHGVKAEMVGDGVAAVERAAAGNLDVILMDVQMPTMDGISACQAIREGEQEGQAIPIIALTASALKGERECFLAAGMNDYVSKPIDRDKLITAILRATAL